MARFNRADFTDSSNCDCTICYLPIPNGQEVTDEEGVFVYHRNCLTKHQAAVAECKAIGHDYSGDGYEASISPNSAKETFTCQRCGYEAEVTYF